MAERSAAVGRLPRGSVAGVWITLMLFSFTQRPGQTTFDTKFDLTADPGAFMARSLHLWNQQSSFGELQNQAYGYLFPQGLLALLGQQAGLADWVVQRLWSGLVLIVAFEGTRRLFRALSPYAPPWVSLLAGVGYATAPRLLGLSGVLSAEVLPTAVLPWVVVPLVSAQRGRLGVRTAALLSGCALLLMGGVNAVENLAVYPLPLLVVLSTLRRPGGRRLAGWWLASAAAASAWWMLPLLVLGRYSPPFLDYIETSTATVRPLGWTNVTRGADHWLSYIYVGDQPWWPGSYDLSTSPTLMIATAVVAALGFSGLARKDMPLRGPLIASALIGLTCLTIARAGTLASPIQPVVQYLLDNSLSMLRNVHKVDPLVRLPLALGLGHAVGLMASRRREARRWRVLPLVSVVAAAVVVVVAAQPLFAGTLRKPGWSSVPSYWPQAAAFLAAHADGRATLILPGSGFGQQQWGWTIDEPMQGLARSPWITRSQVPLTPGATIRFLDSIEERDDDGLGSPALADVLARAGIGYVLVRRDLDVSASGAPTPARVDKALGRSPGFTRVAGFGNSGLLDQAAIDVFRVDRAVDRVEAQPLADVRTLVGGPEDVLTALEAGAVGADEPVLIQPTDAYRHGSAPDVVGDGYRRRERQFGRVHDSVSQIMASQEHYRITRSANDYPGVPGVDRVSARYSGLESVTASTSSGYVDTLGASDPEHGPYAAVDGRDDTFWQSAPLTDPIGQWVQVRLSRATPVDQLEITAGVDGISGTPVRRIRVEAGRQSRSYSVDPTSGLVHAVLDGSPVSTIRVTVTRAVPGQLPVAIREIRVPGTTFPRVLDVPDAGADAHTTFVMRARPHRRACVETPVGPSCLRGQGRTSEEEGGILRRITVHGSGTWRIDGSVVALPTRAAVRLLHPLFGQVRVRASSMYLDEPGVAGQLAYDGNLGTSWLADSSDEHPTLRLSWKKPVTLSRLQVVGAGGTSITPTSAVLTSGSVERRVRFGSAGLGFFPPFTARRLRITFDRPASGDVDHVLGVAELKIAGLEDERYDLSPGTATGAICGLGPEVVVDGVVHRTSVSGTVGAVIDGGPLEIAGCSGGPLDLGSGAHTVRFLSTAQFQPTALTLTPVSNDQASSSSAEPDRQVVIRDWTTHDRTVSVAAGSASVLRIPENRNAGWQASLDGKALTPMTVDGWQQGFRLPAGAGGTVRLHFAPDSTYRLGLFAGGGLAVVLVGAALVALLLGRRRASQGVPMGIGAAGRRRRSVRRGAGAALVAGGYLFGGPGVLLGVALGLLSGRYLVPPGRLAGPAVALAGSAAGITAALSGPGLPPLWTDLVAAVGVGLFAAAWLVAPEQETGR
ncbi:alpha-(1-_3)-arabinofuranosyltransferase domain-containing protein [Nocardioides pocheonensis]|nr:alpha-(1->3)-arabinofuranosyltransferase family protein [Nocardioides pocheonensis]